MVMFISIGIVIWIIVSICLFYNDGGGDIKDFITNAAASFLMVGVCYTLAGGIIFMSISSSSIVPKEWQYSYENKIVKMKDSEAYIVSRHNVEKSDRYYYMVDHGGNHYKQYWVPQSSSDIYEVDNQSYVIKTYTQVRAPKTWVQSDLTKFADFLWNGDYNLERRWEFYIPKGSIIQDFKL